MSEPVVGDAVADRSARRGVGARQADPAEVLAPHPAGHTEVPHQHAGAAGALRLRVEPADVLAVRELRTIAIGVDIVGERGTRHGGGRDCHADHHDERA